MRKFYYYYSLNVNGILKQRKFITKNNNSLIPDNRLLTVVSSGYIYCFCYFFLKREITFEVETLRGLLLHGPLLSEFASTWEIASEGCFFWMVVTFGNVQ